MGSGIVNVWDFRTKIDAQLECVKNPNCDCFSMWWIALLVSESLSSKLTCFMLSNETGYIKDKNSESVWRSSWPFIKIAYDYFNF